MMFKRMRWAIEDKIYQIIDRTMGKNKYNIPYRKPLMLMASGMMITSAIVPDLGLGFFSGLALIKKFGKRDVYLDLREE